MLNEFLWVMAKYIGVGGGIKILYVSLNKETYKICLLVCASKSNLHVFVITCNPSPFKMTTGSRAALTAAVDIRTT